MGTTDLPARSRLMIRERHTCAKGSKPVWRNCEPEGACVIRSRLFSKPLRIKHSVSQSGFIPSPVRCIASRSDDVFVGNICFAAPDHSTPSTQVRANLRFKFIGQTCGLIDQQSCSR